MADRKELEGGPANRHVRRPVFFILRRKGVVRMRTIRWMGLTIALMSAVTCAAQTGEYTWSPPQEGWTLENAVVESGTISPMPVYETDGTTPLRMEAEAASDITGPVIGAEDEECGGDRYMYIPDMSYRGDDGAAVFRINVEQPGRYRFWVRTFWPSIGSNSFYLGLDDGEKNVYGNSEEPGQIKNWHWLDGPAWDLDAGLHTVTVRWREDGTMLDLGMLAPAEYEPSDATDLNSPADSVMPPRMSATTQAFEGHNVQDWVSASLTPDALYETARFEASADRGETWQDIGRGDLSGIAASEDGSGTLRLRVEIPDPTPETVVQAIDLTYRGEPWRVTLENERFAFSFSTATGALIEIENLQTDTIVSQGEADIFWLDYLPVEGGEVASIPPESVRFDQYHIADDPPQIDLLYSVTLPEGVSRVRCHAELPPDGMPTFRAEVDNRFEGLDIVEVHYPVISGARIGDDYRDDRLIWPRWGMRDIPEAANNAPGDVVYPGGGANMPWMDLYQDGENAQGLYMAAHDETILMGELRAEGMDNVDALRMGLSKVARVSPDETYRTSDFIILPHEGDWHAAADVYREWFQSWTQRPDHPEWVIDADGWLGGGRGTNFLEDLPARYRAARRLGLNYSENWGQMMWGRAVSAGGCNRLYFPDPRYGTEEEFAEAIGYVRKAGGHIGFYTNGMAWNPRYPQLRECYDGLMPEDVLIPDWEKEYHNYAIVQANGEYLPQYARPEDDDSPYPGAFFFMCSASDGWRNYLHHYIVGRYVEQYGVDAMYMDMVAAARAKRCYAKNHEHGDAIGTWGRGHLENFRRIKTDGRKTEPEFAIATEGFVDVYSQYVNIFLLSPVATEAWTHSAPEVIHYTLPEVITYDGFANGVPNRVCSDEHILNNVFVNGQRFDYWRRGEDANTHALDLIRLRQETGRLQYRGRFMDDVGLSVSNDAVRAKLWRLDNEDARGWLVALVNEGGVAGAMVTVDTPAAGPLSGQVATIDSMLTPTDLAQEGEKTTFVVPEAEASTVLLLEEARPWLLRADCPMGMPGARENVELRYRPLGGTNAAAASVTAQLPDGWGGGEAQFTPDRSQDVQVPVQIPGDAEPGVYPVTVDASIGDETWSTEGSIIVEDSIEVSATVRGRAVEVAISNRGGADVTATCAAEGPEGLIFPEGPVECAVGAASEATCQLPWTAEGEIREEMQVTVNVEVQDRAYTARATIEPVDLSPENWDEVHYSGEIEHSREADGTVLSLTAKTTEARASWKWHTTQLAPGTTYRFSADVKVEDVQSDGRASIVRVIRTRRNDPSKAQGEWILTQPLTGSSDWQEVGVEIPVTEETGGVQIELFLWSASGTSSWRNMSLEPVQE